MKPLTKQRILSPLLSLSPLLFYLTLSSGAMVVWIILLSIANGGLPSLNTLTENPLILITDQICMAVGALIGSFLLRKRNGSTLKRALRFKNFDWTVPIMLLVFAWAAGELCDHFVGLLLSDTMTIEPNRSIPEGVGGVIIAVIGAPIAEELLFRYCGLEFLRGSYALWIICVCNSLYFATMHLYNIQGFLNVFIGGFTMAYVYGKTRNLWYTIIEHALHNALCLIPLFDNVYYEKNGFVLGKGWWVAVNAVLLAGSLAYYFLYFRRKYTENYFVINRETGLPEPELTKSAADSAAS